MYHLESCWLQGVYSNRPHCLVKFDLPPGTHRLTLALAQYKPVDHRVDYTLDVYAMAPFKLRALPHAMRHTERATVLLLAVRYVGVSTSGISLLTSLLTPKHGTSPRAV